MLDVLLYTKYNYIRPHYCEQHVLCCAREPPSVLTSKDYSGSSRGWRHPCMQFWFTMCIRFRLLSEGINHTYHCKLERMLSTVFKGYACMTWVCLWEALRACHMHQVRILDKTDTWASHDNVWRCEQEWKESKNTCRETKLTNRALFVSAKTETHATHSSYNITFLTWGKLVSNLRSIEVNNSTLHCNSWRRSSRLKGPVIDFYATWITY